MEKITAGRRIGTVEGGVKFLTGYPTSKKLKAVRSKASSCLGEESSRQRGLQVHRPRGRKGSKSWRNSSVVGEEWEEMKVER